MSAKPALKIVPPAPPAPAKASKPVRKLRTHVIYGVESGLKLVDLREAWEYRELAFLFARRDLKLRYAQTSLGVMWTILQPLFSTGIFTILFAKLVKIPSDKLPYPVFNYLGLLLWIFFTNGISRCSTCLVANAHMLTKVYFPRLLIPVSSLLPGLVDLGIGIASAIPLLLYYGITPSWSAIVWVPVLCLTVTFQCLGLSLFMSALNVRFRDVGNLLPVFLQLAVWLTPISYPLSLVPERYRPWVCLNPAVGYVEAFRSVMVGRPINFSLLGVSVAAAAVLMLIGLSYFRRVEATFADIV